MAFINITSMSITLLSLVVIGLIIYIALTEMRLHKSEPKSSAPFDLPAYIEQLLQQLNCHFKKEEHEGWLEFNFSFQNGNFVLLCQPNGHDIVIHYPNFFSVEIDYLEKVREACNTSNTRTRQHHVVYTPDGKNNQLSLHITSSMPVVNQDPQYIGILSKNLSQFFTVAREFYVHFQVLKEKNQGTKPSDIEKDYLKYEREFFILKEMETHHYEEKDEHHFAPNRKMCISDIVKKFYNFEQPEFLELKVITHQLKTFVSEEEIKDFDISQVLVSLDHDGSPNFCGRNANLILTFFPNRNKTEGFPQQMTIALNNEGRSAHALYQRVTLSMPSVSPHQKNITYEEYNKTQLYSFVIAYESAENVEKRNALHALVKETNEKMMTRAFQNPNGEEALVLQFTSPDIQAYKVYADQLFREKRYYEVVCELEYLYHFLSAYYLSFNKIQQNFFYDVCYYIGVSYCELGLHEQAYNYLDIIFPLNNITYMEAYVNNLVNGRDFRALNIIENINEAIQNQLEANGGEVPENIRHFQIFLQRRKAYHLTDLGYYNEAKKIYEALYQDPECQDDILNELAYLQRICKSEKTNDNKEYKEDQ